MDNLTPTASPVTIFEGAFMNIINQYVIAIVILFSGFILGNILAKIVKKILHEIELNNFLKSVSNIDIRIEELISMFVKFLVYFIFVVYVLNYLNLSTIIINVLLIVVLVIVGFSVIVSVRNFLPDFFAGIAISKRKLIFEGDIIEIDGIIATIKKIDLTSIQLLTKDNELIFYPASQFLRKKLKILPKKDQENPSLSDIEKNSESGEKNKDLKKA
jgi:small-conductance mechanosensitive channel